MKGYEEEVEEEEEETRTHITKQKEENRTISIGKTNAIVNTFTYGYIRNFHYICIFNQYINRINSKCLKEGRMQGGEKRIINRHRKRRKEEMENP